MQTFIICACLALTLSAAANGPAWIAELSDEPAHLERSQDISVNTCEGEAVTIGIYNTDAVTVTTPEGVLATEPLVIWYEHRTVYRGMPDEREEAIPYYLPAQKWHPATGSWAVRLTPYEPGNYVIAFGTNMGICSVRLHVAPGVPAADCGFGFYSEFSRMGRWQTQ